MLDVRCSAFKLGYSLSQQHWALCPPAATVQVINPATKDPEKGNAGYRRQSLIFLDAGSESGMTGWSI